MARLLPHGVTPESLISRGLQAGPGQEVFKPGGFWATFFWRDDLFFSVFSKISPSGRSVRIDLTFSEYPPGPYISPSPSMRTLIGIVFVLIEYLT